MTAHPYDSQCICEQCCLYEVNLTARAQWDRDQALRVELRRKRTEGKKTAVPSTEKK